MNWKKILFGAAGVLGVGGIGLGVKAFFDGRKRQKIEEEQAAMLAKSQKNANEMLDLIIKDQETIKKRQDEIDRAFDETLKQMSKRRKKEEEKIFNGPTPTEMKADIED